MKALFFYAIMFILCSFTTLGHAKLNDNNLKKYSFYENNFIKRSPDICKKIEHYIYKNNYNAYIKNGYLKGTLTIAECNLWAILDAKEEYNKCVIISN